MISFFSNPYYNTEKTNTKEKFYYYEFSSIYIYELYHNSNTNTSTTSVKLNNEGLSIFFRNNNSALPKIINSKTIGSPKTIPR